MSKRYPKWIFNLSAKLFGEADLELCILHKNSTKDCPYVYLIMRTKDDKYWPGKMHIPGTRKRSGDTEYEQLERAISETPFYIDKKDIKYAYSCTRETKRGTQFADVRYVFVDTDKLYGFYSAYNLPKNTIDFHVPMIHEVINIVKEKGLFHE